MSPDAALAVSRDAITSLDTLDKRSVIVTYAEFLNSTRIYNETIQSLQLDPEVMKRDYAITTAALPDANILELSVEGPDPSVAVVVANTLGQRAVSEIKELYQVFDISMLDPAVIPDEPVRPQPLRDSALAIALGLVIGAALAIIVGQAQTRWMCTASAPPWTRCPRSSTGDISNA